MTIPPGVRKWLAMGSGVGIEIAGDELRVALVRVRPSGVTLQAVTAIDRFRERPADEWGREYSDFLKRHGARHLSAAVLLPRSELIVRHLALPGISDRDLAAAIRFQIDSLHPYAEDDAAWAWARIGESGAVLIAIVRREVLDEYTRLFSEAGVMVASFTLSAAVLHTAVRLYSAGPGRAFLTLMDSPAGTEAYGESEARPVFSAVFDLPQERVAALAAAELRLEEGGEPVAVGDLLPRPRTAPGASDLAVSAYAYAAALAGACPWLSLPVNLLPAERRSSTSRVRLVPAAALAVVLAAALIALGAISPIEDRKYLAALEREIARYEPQARRAAELDRAIEDSRSRVRLLDDFRRRSKSDLDALAELTRILEPPAWLHSLDLSRQGLTLTGESDQSAGLLKTLDSSPLFSGSEFTVPLSRKDKAEVFRIRASREGAPQ